MPKPFRTVLLLALLLSLVAGGKRVAVQSGSPTILLVVSASAPNPFGRYLDEVLKADGLNAVTTVDLNSVNAGVLASAKLVVLAEMPLSGAQAQLFIDHVNLGGRLVAMRPDAKLAATLGVIPAGTSQTNGYLAINQSQPSGAGLASATLPFAGSADHYTPIGGNQTLATLYSSLTTATPYAAVVRSGRTATWAFDLARSVAYRRQGDPALSGVERDGTLPYRTMEPFYQAIDRERMSVPHVDVQVRLFSRTIVDLLADNLPLPRLWYFPGGARALMVVASDAHVHDQGALDSLLGKVESLGGTMTYYPSRWLPYPTASAAAAWRQRGHEIGVHPIGYGDGVSLAQGWTTSVNYFTAANWGPHGTTARTHDEEWVGWVGGAELAAANGVKMELSAYTWGPAIGDNIGPQAKGYITGSGLPMRFVDQSGTLLPVHQQLTSLIDHQLFINDGYSELTTIANGLTFTRQMVDQAVSDYHTALVTQFQADYYLWGEVKGWVDGTLDYAASRGLPLWAAQRWSNYTLARDGATIEAPVFDQQNRRLVFTLRVPPSSEALSLVLPAVYDGAAIGQVSVNGATSAVQLQTINGRASAFFSVPATAAGSPVPFTIVAAYGASVGDTTPPAIGNVATTATGPTTATVTWTTSEPATSQVEYGVGSPTSATPTDTTLVTSHSVALTGLSPSTSYVYRVVSRDAATNGATSPEDDFTTPAAATPSLSVNDVSATEGTGGASTLTFTVTLSNASSSAVTVAYATSAGTAGSPADFAAASGTLTFTPGATTRTVPIALVTDTLDEPAETFTIALSSPTGATIADGSGTGTISDDDPAPGLTVADTSVSEGTGPAATASVVVRLSAASGQSVSVGYATANGSAVAPGDFSAVSGTLTFAPGVTTQTIAVPIVADALVEGSEAFVVQLSAPVNATIADGSATVSIVDDDDSGGGGGPVTLTLAVGSGDSDANEVSGALQSGTTMWIGNEAATGSIAATRFTGVAIPRGATVTSAHLEVRAAATNWNRIAFEYAAEASGQSAPFGPGALPSQRPLSAARVNHLTDAQWVSGTWYTLDEIAPIVQEVVNRGDWASGNALSILMRGTGFAWGRKFAHAYEGDPASAARLVVTYTGGGPTLPALSINDLTVTEGTGGARSANFTVSLSASPTQSVTVGFATANGTATAPADYTAGSGTLTFGVGVTSQTVSVPIVTDSTVESNETFSVVLSNPTNATIADGTGVATIVDDDAVIPSIVIADTSLTEGTGGTQTAAFTVTLSVSPTQTVTVGFATANGTATAPADYTAGSGTLTFGVGVTSQTVSVPIVTDSTVESNETFSVVLSNPINATIADGTGVATIVNDDQPLPTLSINDLSVTEGTGGSTTATLTVTLSASSTQTVTVTATTANGTATSPADFTGGSGTVTFVPGVTSATVQVPVVTDSTVESNETFTVVLSNPANATIADGTGVVTILDDDVGAGPVTATFQIAAGADDVTQEATSLTANGNPMWIGTGSSATSSYVGLRFAGVTIPRNATITSARLEVNAASTAWITLGFEFGIEAAASSAAFSAASLPSARPLLAPRVLHSSNQQWTANNWIVLDDLAAILQALVNRADWNPGNALGLIVRGTAGAWSRKPIKSFETAAAMAPRLVVTYTVP